MPTMLLLTMVDVSLGSLASGRTLVGQRWDDRHNKAMTHSMAMWIVKKRRNEGSCVVVVVAAAAAAAAASC